MFVRVDEKPSRRWYWGTPLLVLACLSVAVWQALADPGQRLALLQSWGTVPSELRMDISALLGGPGLRLFSALFVHADWTHLFGNLLFLGLFGSAVERSLGSVRCLVLFLIAGAAANLFAALMSPLMNAPIIGSSGAVSALIGAYVLLFPRSNLGVILPLGLYFQLVRVPALHLIGIWLLFQVLETLGSRSGAVAWWAHVFGFINGLFLALTLRPWLYRRDARLV
ncbi:MAG: rhomboid family intramembrane serine protease [Lysobacterales bacterium]